jgi:hypothetical protein
MVFSFGNHNNNHNAHSAFSFSSATSSSSSSSSSSCDHDEQQEDLEEEGRVEVTVQRLDGILWVDDADNKNDTRRHHHHHHHQKLFKLPHLTATVSFAGSADDMQIGSSTVCGLTGQLLVESAPLIRQSSPSSSPDDGDLSLIPPAADERHADRQQPAKNHESGRAPAVWLTAEWPEQQDATQRPHKSQPHVTESTSSTIISTISSTHSTLAGLVVQQPQPHVRMQFPGALADPRLPKPCLVQSNRGSKIVKQEQQQQQQQQSSSHHKKTNSNAGLETAATFITDFTSFSSEGGGYHAGSNTPPALSPSSSSSSSLSSSGQQEQLLNQHGSRTATTSITGMEKLVNKNQPQPQPQQQQNDNVNNNNNNNDNAAQQQQQQQQEIAMIAMARGESAFWSHSGQAMPEILELHIRLRCHDASQNFDEKCITNNTWEGVSYLVLFGQEDDQGSHIVDLPV